MVATTFAADTPLWVTGQVVRHGVAANWFWWSFLLSGMMTVFFFARMWRRAEIITDVELVELRYAGKPAAFLRGFRAIYFGVLINCIILGWVWRPASQRSLCPESRTRDPRDGSALTTCRPRPARPDGGGVPRGVHVHHREPS
jgi:hypothetical protein